MSMIAEQVRAEMALSGARRVTAVSADYAAAVALALAHACTHLSLPAVVPIVWHYHPGGHSGETHWFSDGRVEVHLNAGLDLSPRSMAWTALHEFRHVADGQQFCAAYYNECEDTANCFAFDVVQQSDFQALDWRRPSGRR